jgi:hypothetical protein
MNTTTPHQSPPAYVLLSAPLRDRLKLLAAVRGQTMRACLDSIVEAATASLESAPRPSIPPSATP